MTQIDRINGLIGSIAIKAPCRVATTANITLSGEQTIDTVAVVADDRVVVKNQTNQTENGIYDASATAWSRAADFDGNRDFVKGTVVRVLEGTAGGIYYEVTSEGVIVGESNIIFAATTLPLAPDTFYLVANKTAAQALTAAQDGDKVFITSDDGGEFTVRYNATPATYADDGGSYCGTQFIPSGGDGTIGIVRDGDISEYNSDWFGLAGTGAAIWAAIQALPADGGTVVVPAYPSAYEYSGNWDIATLAKPVRIKGTNVRDGDIVDIYFTQIDSTDAITFGSNLYLENLKIRGNRAGGHSGDGLVSILAGGCDWQNVTIRDFGRDNIHVENFFINEGRNVTSRNAGRCTWYLDVANENRYYNSKGVNSGQDTGTYAASDRCDIWIVEGNANIFDVDVGNNSTGEYSVRIDEGYGNRIEGWHDGGTDALAKLGTSTTHNTITLAGAFSKGSLDEGISNHVLNTDNANLSPADVRQGTFPLIKNLIRNSSATGGTNGWSPSDADSLSHITTEGGVTGQSIKAIFSASASGASFGVNNTVIAVASGDIVVMKAKIKASRALDSDEHVGMAFTATTAYPDRPTAYQKIGTEFNEYTFAWRATAVSSDINPLFKLNSNAAIDISFTDVMVAINPPCHPSQVPFIYTANDTFVEVDSARIYRANTDVAFLTSLAIVEEAPVDPSGGMIAMAGGRLWDPASVGLDTSYLVHFELTNTTRGAYSWTVSTSGTNEYYLEASGGGDPGITPSEEVHILKALATQGTVGSLAVDEWDYGDNDTLGYSTLYVRLTSGISPVATDYVMSFGWAQV